MTESNTELERLNPDKLVGNFAQSGITKFLAIAVALHLVVLGVTSLGYMYEQYLQWFDPPAYAAYVQAKEDAKKAAESTSTPATAPASSPETTPGSTPGPATNGTTPANGAAPATNGQPATTAAQTGMEGIPEDKRDNPVVKAITEAAKPDEIPSKPDDLGISIQDTNP